VVLIHQGLYTRGGINGEGCDNVTGELPKVLEQLDSRVDLVVSGHTHWSYICDYAKVDPARPMLVTSAGLWGQYITDIDLTIDPVLGKVTARRAAQVMVQSEAYVSTGGRVEPKPQFEQFPPDPAMTAYVQRYADAVRVQKERRIGKISASTGKPDLATDESRLGNLIADGQLAATRSAGAQLALMNNTGIRGDLIANDDTSVTFGAIYAVQPFANDLVTMTFTGAQLKALFEQQFDGQSFDQAFSPSANVAFAFDLKRPLGERVFDITIDGKPLDPIADYRVTMNSFLAGGGDNFTVFRQGRNKTVGGIDLDAMEAWIAGVPRRELPELGRVRNLTEEHRKAGHSQEQVEPAAALHRPAEQPCARGGRNRHDRSQQAHHRGIDRDPEMPRDQKGNHVALGPESEADAEHRSHHHAGRIEA
jgi:5'-nucleotidase